MAQIVVERLTKNVNEGHLREIFGAYGSIRDLDLPMNRQCINPLPPISCPGKANILSHDQPWNCLHNLQRRPRRRSSHSTYA